MTPRQIDQARAAAASALAEAKHPDTGSRLFPQIIETAQCYGIDPTHEGYPDLIALPDEPYWVRTKLSSGLAWVEPDPNQGWVRAFFIKRLASLAMLIGGAFLLLFSMTISWALAAFGHWIDARIE